MTINERFNDIIKTLYKGNKRSFAIAIGVSATVIENVVGKRQGKPSYDVIDNVCAKANISPEWLLTGRGSMLRTGESAPIQGNNNSNIRIADRKRRQQPEPQPQAEPQPVIYGGSLCTGCPVIAQLAEKDRQIQEKDAQISTLLSIINKKP